jgi:hypothetical protein
LLLLVRTLKILGYVFSILVYWYWALGTLVPVGTSEVRLLLTISYCVAYLVCCYAELLLFLSLAGFYVLACLFTDNFALALTDPLLLYW